jgi:preprotein translocase subunit SecD
VGAEPYFSITDVDSANVYLGSEGDGKPLYAVNIHFRPSLDDSMRSLSGHLIGRRLAFVVDGRILATPRILDTIQTARVGLFATTEAEARELAKKIIRAIRTQ